MTDLLDLDDDLGLDGLDLDLDDGLDLGLDDDLALDLDLDLDDEDLLDLGGKRLKSWQELNIEVEAALKAGKDFPRESPVGEFLEYETWGECYKYWRKFAKEKPNSEPAETLAYNAGVKILAQASALDVKFQKVDKPTPAAVIDLDGGKIQLLCDLPQGYGQLSNCKFLPNSRAVWFDRKTGKPIDKSEPFCLA